MKNLDFKAISHWFATGFFENDEKSFLFNSEINKNNFSPQIKWFYEPRNISINKAINEFGDLFESIIDEKIKNKKTILPLSGGLDSRTIAAALKHKKNITTYSYEFENGTPEIKYAQSIAKAHNWEFYKFKIKKGYLWDRVEEISSINQCRTEFTHPRQMAVIKQIANLGNILLSGSMGDLLFDSYNLNDNLEEEGLKNFIKKITIKPSGLEFAMDYWFSCGLDGDFNSYLNNILDKYISKIILNNNSNKAKAIKVDYYVKNWTNTNLKIFDLHVPTFAPYHDERMCKFICTIPEEFLKNRKIQIDYIKKKAPLLAKIPWQAYDLNLYKFQRFNTLYLPRRLYSYAKREISYKFFKKSKPLIRNWELQFLGLKNKKYLENWLFNNEKLNSIVPHELVKRYYDKFNKNDKVYYSHVISMLLTLSVWSKKNDEN